MNPDTIEYKIAEELCDALEKSHEDLLSTFLELKRGPHRSIAIEQFVTNIANWTQDSPNEKLARISQNELHKAEKLTLKGELSDKDLTGVVISNSTGTRGAFFLPDASEPGRFRMTLFDENGFSGHITRDTYNELASMTLEYGFSKIDDNLLIELSTQESFSKGNLIASAIARVNEGRMTHKKFAQYVKRIEEGEESSEELSI